MGFSLRRKVSNQQNWPAACCLLIGQGLFAFGDAGALWGHLGVELDVFLHLSGNVVFMKNGFDRALGDTGFAVDAFIRVDVEHGFPFVEAFYGANNNAIRISAAITGLGDDVSHANAPDKEKVREFKVKSANSRYGKRPSRLP
jgi:hypothetical protein